MQFLFHGSAVSERFSNRPMVKIKNEETLLEVVPKPKSDLGEVMDVTDEMSSMALGSTLPSNLNKKKKRNKK